MSNVDIEDPFEFPSLVSTQSEVWDRQIMRRDDGIVRVCVIVNWHPCGRG